MTKTHFNIALINVPYGNSTNFMRPLGLASLGAFLTDHGHNVTGFDFASTFMSSGKLVSFYDLAAFSLVGLSFYNTNAIAAYKLADAIKRMSPTTVIVAGGPHPSALGETMLKDQKSIDIVVRNEGEYPLKEIVEQLVAGAPLDGVKGCSFRTDDQIVTTPSQERVSDLDALPSPNFSFVSPHSPKRSLYYDQVSGVMKNAAPIVTSRSCPYRCSFCSIISIGRQWRHASPEKIVYDLQSMEDFFSEEYTHLYFLDANFFVSAKRAIQVAQALNNFRPELTFSFSTRANQIVQFGMHFAELYRLGLRTVEVGIESASQSVLDRLGKDTTTTQNRQAIQILRKNGIELLLDFIMFDAFTGIDDLEDNISFLEEMHLDTILPWDHLFNHLTPYLGTPIRKTYESDISIDWDVDQLPSGETLIQDKKVRQIFQQLNRLKPHLSIAMEVIGHIEESIGGTWTKEHARLLLNATTLRRMPFRALKSLVRNARSGKEVLLEDALPSFSDDQAFHNFIKEFRYGTLFKAA